MTFLPSKTVLITGVSTGIGRAIAQAFLEDEWHVYGSVRNTGDSKELLDFEDFHELVFDVTDAATRRKAVAKIRENGHMLSILINNAGVAISGPLEVLPEEDYRKQFEVNVFGVLGLTQDCLPLMHQTREEFSDVPVRIINITSVSGILTSPFTSIYSASKFALESITDGLRRELLPFGIDAVSIAPGPVKTPIWDKSRKRDYIYKGNRYAFILKKLSAYVTNAEKSAIAPEIIAKAAHASAIATKPKTRKLLLANKWTVKLISKMPSRMVDKLVWRNINNARRY